MIVRFLEAPCASLGPISREGTGGGGGRCSVARQEFEVLSH